MYVPILYILVLLSRTQRTGNRTNIEKKKKKKGIGIYIFMDRWYFSYNHDSHFKAIIEISLMYHDINIISVAKRINVY